MLTSIAENMIDALDYIATTEAECSPACGEHY